MLHTNRRVGSIAGITAQPDSRGILIPAAGLRYLAQRGKGFAGKKGQVGTTIPHGAIVKKVYTEPQKSRQHNKEAHKGVARGLAYDLRSLHGQYCTTSAAP